MSIHITMDEIRQGYGGVMFSMGGDGVTADLSVDLSKCPFFVDFAPNDSPAVHGISYQGSEKVTAAIVKDILTIHTDPPIPKDQHRTIRVTFSYEGVH